MPVIRRALSSYPEVVRAIGDRHINYNQELAYVRQREAGKYAYVIRPEGDLDIGRIEHDRHKIRTVYKEGRRLARRHLSAIRRFLAAAKTESGSTSGSIIRNAPSEETAAIELLQTPVEKVPVHVEEAAIPVEKAPEPAEEIAASIEKAPESAEEAAAPVEKAPEPVEETAVPVEKATEPLEEVSVSAQPAGISLEETPPPHEETKVPDFTYTAPVEKDKAEASGGSPDESSDESSGNTFILRSSRGNRSGKKWKPGKMTSLKSKCNQDSSSDPD